MESAGARLSDLEAELREDNLVWSVDAALQPLVHEIDVRVREDARMLQSRPGLDTLTNLETNWRALAEPIPDMKRRLDLRLSQLDRHLGELEELYQLWQKTLEDARQAELPSDLLASVEKLSETILLMQQKVKERRTDILSQQNAVAAQEARTQEGLRTLGAARKDVVTQVFVRDVPPLWSPELTHEGMGEELATSLRAQWTSLVAYLARQNARLLFTLFVWLFCSLVIGRMRRQARTLPDDDPAADQVRAVVARPLRTALLPTVLLGGWLDPPRLVGACLGAVALIPAVSILRRLIEPMLRPLLYALVIFYFTDQLRAVAAAVPLLQREMLLAEMLLALLFLAWYWRRLPTPHSLTREILLKVGAAALFTAGAAALLGYMALASMLSRAFLSSSYTGVIFYGAFKVTDGLFVLLLRTRPLCLLNMARNHGDDMRRPFQRVCQFFFVLSWTGIVLRLLTLDGPIIGALYAVLGATLTLGTLKLSLGGILGFLLILWAGRQLSRFLRFVLEQDVYPNLTLSRGAPYALSTLVHYILMLVSVLTALSAVGVDTTKFAVVAGALSVGIGLGLQNIVNNFVSGLILLFDRDVNVGDTIKVGDFQGQLRYVGLRCSILVIGDGSEVIIPNADLMNQRVVNWSTGGQYRRLELRLNVALDSEPDKVVKILRSAAEGCQGVRDLPAPQALMLGFGKNALSFQLLVWAEEGQKPETVKSELALMVNAALKEAGVAVAVEPA